MKESFIGEAQEGIVSIFQRFKARDFSGNTGLAIKNSVYSLFSNITTKIGSLVFTIILARFLMPELFGLYNLVLSIIMIFYVLSDLGSNQTLIYFVSKKLGSKNYSEAKSYARFILFIKILLIITSIIILLLSSKFLAENYTQKPIFLALMAGALYIFFSSIQSFMLSLFYSYNNFRIPFFREVLLQILKIIFVPLGVLFILKKMPFNNSMILFLLILLLSLAYSVTFLFTLILSKRTLNIFEKAKKISISKKKDILKFMIRYSAIALSLILFGNIDKIILGHFVSPEYIGYYSVAFGIISSIIPLIVFSDVLFPIFLKIKNKRAEFAFRKSLKVTIAISFLAFLFLFFFSEPIIRIIFGKEYVLSASLLRMYSLILIGFPAAEIFSNYLISRGQLKSVSKLIISLIPINLLLAYFFPFFLLKYGSFAATMGVVAAMIISRYFYLVGLVLIWRKNLSNSKRR
jgi:O-antigen/teichoic acid export membrane protein